MSHQNRLTLAECNAMLPLVRVVAAEIVERRRARARLARQRDDLEGAKTPEGVQEAVLDLESEIYAHDDGIRRAAAELEHYGLTVLRLNPLVIHFPGRTRDAELVFCWQEDEQTISHGHPQGQEEEPRFPLKLRQ